MASPAGSPKKDREKAVLQHLLRCAEIEAQILEAGEAPDFILEIDGHRVGAEITQYVRGRSEQGSAERRQHRFIQPVLDEAKEAFAKRSSDALYVTVDPLSGTAEAARSTLAAGLSEAVRGCLDGGEIQTRPCECGIAPSVPAFHECLVPEGLRQIMDRITVVELPAGSISSWRIRQSGDTRAYVAELEALISSKEPRVSSYLERSESVWLVIDAFGADILQAVTPSGDLVNHRYRTGFSKVFQVDTTETTVHQLWTVTAEQR
jgi:hypothetical protein